MARALWEYANFSKTFSGPLSKGRKKIYFFISMILKKSCMQMSLIQHVISFLLYANGTKREVRIWNFYLIVYCLGIHIPATVHNLYATFNHQ